MNRLACYFNTPETVNLPILLSPPGNQVMCEWHNPDHRTPKPYVPVHALMEVEADLDGKEMKEKTDIVYWAMGGWFWAGGLPLQYPVKLWTEFPEVPRI